MGFDIHFNREKFLQMLADTDGDPEASKALNERLARLLGPIIEQAAIMAQQAPQEGAPGGNEG